MKNLIRRAFRFAGFDIVSAAGKDPRDFSDAEIDVWQRVREFTMTSQERIIAALRAAEYVGASRIPGAIVECGVWRGGSMMAIAFGLSRVMRRDIPLYLFDTFTGMTKPTDQDGRVALKKWKWFQKPTHNEWCYASLEDVRANLGA